jgi:hypothetical protein
MQGYADGSVAFRRKAGAKYAITCFRAKLEDVARETKPLPPQYVNARSNGIAESFRKYAGPLVGKLPVVGKLS